jgi:hypothetical protein
MLPLLRIRHWLRRLHLLLLSRRLSKLAQSVLKLTENGTLLRVLRNLLGSRARVVGAIATLLCPVNTRDETTLCRTLLSLSIASSSCGNRPARPTRSRREPNAPGFCEISFICAAWLRLR